MKRIAAFSPGALAATAVSALFFAGAPAIAVAQDAAMPPGAAETTAADSGEAGFSPKSYDLSRYEKIRTKSPFEFELPAAPAPEVANPFENIVLSGYVGMGKSVTVYLTNSKTNERFTVFGAGSNRKNENGFQVLEILKGKSMRSSKVRLEKDGKTEEVSFDTTALSNMRGGSAAGGAGGAMPPGAPGGMTRGPNGQPMLRPGQPGGAPAAPMQQYQAPQAFVPGQQQQQQQQQPQGQPQPGIAQTLNGAQVNAQQNAINGLVQQPAQNPPQGQAPVVIGGQPPAATPGTQPRARRVVLPSPR